MVIVYEYSSLLKIPPSERLDICSSIIKNEEDESLRGEAVWVLGKTWTEVGEGDPTRKIVAELLEFAIKNDDNEIVRHEAAYQLGEHNMREKIPILIDLALHDTSEIVRHEAIEAIGLLEAIDCKEVLKKFLQDKNSGVRQTAVFVLKQLNRLEKAHSSKNP